jgi:hypothetical protein
MSDLVPHRALPAARPTRQERPWHGGARGPDCQLFFDPDDRSLWAFMPEDGRYRRVDNLAVESLTVEHHWERDTVWGLDSQPSRWHRVLKTVVELRAVLLERIGC